MAEEAAVTAAEIARLAGVGRAAVSNWRRRFDDFPKPAGGTDTSPTFKLADIQDWLREQGKLDALSDRELAWQQLEAAAGARPAADMLAAAGAYLAHKPGAHGLNAATKRALDEFAAAEGAEEAFEQLCGRFVEANVRQVAVTPPELAQLMVTLTGPPHGTVLDPACGTGTLLRAAVLAQQAAHPYGQDSERSLAELAAARLAFHTDQAVIRTGDSLRADAFADIAADAIICNPPFNDRNWGFDELAYDPRWAYGMPAKGESELAWVQHCLAHLRPGGNAVLLMPPAVASRRSGRRIRAELLRGGALRAVIALPAGAAPPLGLPLHLWVLQRPTEPPADAGLLLVDTTGGEAGRVDDLSWPLVAKRLLTVWHECQRDPAAAPEEPGVHKVVPVIELLDDEVDLTPARHLRPTADISGLGSTRESLETLLAQLPRLLPNPVTVSGEAGHRAVTSIGALAKSSALHLLQQVAHIDVQDGGEGLPVLTGRDVLAGSEPSGRIREGGELPEQIRLRSGDVVVPTVARCPTALVIDEGGALLGPNLQLVRPDPEQLDPWFLAGFLRNRDSLRFAGTLSGAHRLDVRRVEVPRLPLVEQRRYGEAFRRLAVFERTLRSAAALGQDFTQSLIDGLAAGVLEPDQAQEGP